MSESQLKKGTIRDLTFDDNNFNLHTDFGMGLLEKSLRKHGAGRSIVVDKNGRIIGGNGIVETAAQIGLEKTLVIETTGEELVVVKRTDVDLDTPQGREMALADNATAAADLQWNEEALTKAESNQWGISREEWGLSMPEEMQADEDKRNTQEDDFNEEDEDIPTICKTGDIWQLGRHKLICGDSTNPADIARLMGEEKADLWITDPPYNVAVQNSQGMTIANDNMDSTSFGKFLDKAFKAAKTVLSDGCPFYVWFASCEHINFERSLNNAGLQVRQELIWNKNSFNLGRQHYQWKHEPCLYGWAGKTCKYFIDQRNLASVIQDAAEIDFEKMSKGEMKTLLKKIYEEKIPVTVINEAKPVKDEDHPTMKPVRLFGYQICNSSKRDDIILDTFGGSGTTIIACEQINRSARLVELDPHYCDVIIARWEKFTGNKAVKQIRTK